eukprot:scaffold45130_cov17-Tisochrysis_lutea.AAC.2
MALLLLRFLHFCISTNKLQSAALMVARVQSAIVTPWQTRLPKVCCAAAARAIAGAHILAAPRRKVRLDLQAALVALFRTPNIEPWSSALACRQLWKQLFEIIVGAHKLRQPT